MVQSAKKQIKYNIHLSLWSTLYAYLWLSLFSLLAECNYLVVLCTWVTQLLWLKSLDLVPSCTYYYCLLSSVLHVVGGTNFCISRLTRSGMHVCRPRFETWSFFYIQITYMKYFVTISDLREHCLYLIIKFCWFIPWHMYQ